MAQEHFGITGTLLLRRSLLEYVPGFEPILRASEDYHFYYRLARHAKVGVLNRVGMMRRIHGNNLSSNWREVPSGILCRSLLRDTETNPRARKLLNKKIASFWQALARSEANHEIYLSSYRHYCAALATDPSWLQLKGTLYGLTRTLAIAMGMHRPKKLAIAHQELYSILEL
jgi:hypothetical protein